MKRKITHKLLAIIITSVMMMTTSCRKELCYNHFREADFSLSWEREWEREYGANLQASWDPKIYGLDYDDMRPGFPEWVNLVKYDESGGFDEHFLGKDGGKIMVHEHDASRYLLYNGDTEYIIVSDIASIPEARASASSRSRSTIEYINERHPGIRSTNPPDALYSAYLERVPDIDLHESKKVPVKMQPLVYSYLIRYMFDKGIEYVALARGALGGMAESVYLKDGSTSDEATIILYDCDVKSYGCEALVKSFGVPGFPDEYYGRSEEETTGRPYTLNLEVRLINGKTVEFNFDVADQLIKQPRGGVITLSGISIEQEEASSPSGFEVEVTDWGEHEDIDLPLGN